MDDFTIVIKITIDVSIHYCIAMLVSPDQTHLYMLAICTGTAVKEIEREKHIQGIEVVAMSTKDSTGVVVRVTSVPNL